MTTPVFDSPLRAVTVQIPTAVALKLSETFEGTLEDAALAGLKLINGLGPVAYNTLHVLAKKRDITLARALRRAIDLLQTDSDVSDQKLAHKPVPGRPKINETRDAEIYAQLRAGVTHAVVAQAFGLSLVRIGQIAAQQRLIHGDTQRGRISNPRKTLGAPNLMRMYDEIDAGLSIAEAAQAYGLAEQRVHDLHTAYKSQLAGNPKVTAYDRMQAAHLAAQTSEVRDTRFGHTPARDVALAKLTHAQQMQEVLSLNVSPEAPAEPTTPKPKVLAVIPPSMRNQPAEERLQPVPVNELNMDIFQEDFPLDEVFGLRDVEPGRVAYTNTPK